jgi:hypothetical protein
MLFVEPARFVGFYWIVEFVESAQFSWLVGRFCRRLVVRASSFCALV